jgi:hypothetical protein
MKVMRLVVPSDAAYAIRQLGDIAGVSFDDRQIVDVPLQTNEQVDGARDLEHRFKNEKLSTTLRNGANAVTVHSLEVIDI